MTARRIGTVATLVVLTASAGACSGHTHAQRASPTARFSQFGLTFAYPAAWKPQTWQFVSSFTSLITYLSPVQLHDPCTRIQTPQRIEIDCGTPISTLPPGSVLVSWFNVGFPHQGPAVTAANTTIAHQRARLSIDRPGSCGRLGADETVTADIERPKAGSNFLEMKACLRAPGVAANEKLVRSMLSSTRVASP